ncbi:MAG: nucleotide exchange factor GrpE [Kiritimatiellae bacterium]|nr:nucleotide exchange factor GrpE [Kiritimatiellia bacterium]
MKKDKEKDKTTAQAKAAGEKAAHHPRQAADEELAALKDQLLRLQADFDNFRKRTARERAEWYQRANEDLFLEILPVLDHLELGLRTAAEHGVDPAVVQGLQLVYDQLLAALRKYGLTPVDSEGEVFDPHQHEAVSHLPSDEHPADAIMTQTRRGYRLGDKLLRPAQVVVSSGSGETPQTAPQPRPGVPGEGEMDWGGE